MQMTDRAHLAAVAVAGALLAAGHTAVLAETWMDC